MSGKNPREPRVEGRSKSFSPIGQAPSDAMLELRDAIKDRLSRNANAIEAAARVAKARPR